MRQEFFFPCSLLLAFLLIRQFPAFECAGLTLDPCLKQEHCEKNRICRSARTLEICKATSNYCGCVPINEDEARCDSTTQCDVGETCFHPELWQESPACISDAQIPSIANPKRCESNEDCLPDRICAFVTLVQGYCAIPFIDKDSEPHMNEENDREVKPISVDNVNDSANQPLSMAGSDDIENEPVESNVPGTPSESEDFNNEPSASFEEGNFDLNERACVASRALEHLHPQNLLYKNSFYAKVLCDSYGSCSTPGHIVYHNSRPMMMRSYCAKTVCVERIMAVNSVKYRQKLRVASTTPDLYYTAFSARYQTLAEELALAFAIFLGL